MKTTIYVRPPCSTIALLRPLVREPTPAEAARELSRLRAVACACEVYADGAR